MNTEQTPTPVTDAEADHARNLLLDYDCQGKDDNIPVPMVVPVEVSRNLERQLAEANERIVELKQDREIIHQDCERWRKLSMQHATERDNAVSDFRQSEADCLRAMHERNEARQQLAAERALADRLAHSMERMRMECYSKAYEEWKEARK